MKSKCIIKFTAAIFCIITVFTLSSCSIIDKISGGKISRIKVCCVTTLQSDFVASICGDKAEIVVLEKENSKNYVPSKKDIRKIGKCNLFVYNGDSSDEWVNDALNSLKNKPVVFAFSEALDYYDADENSVLTDEILLQPEVSKKIVRSLYKEFLMIDSKNAATYIENTDFYIKSISNYENQQNYKG